MRLSRFLLGAILSAACLAVPLCQAQARQEDAKTRAKEYYILGNQYYQQGKFKEAQEQYQKAIDLLDANKNNDASADSASSADAPTGTDTVTQDEPQKNPPSKLLSEDSLLQYTIRGNKYYEEGRFKEAQEEYQNAIRAIKGEKPATSDTVDVSKALSMSQEPGTIGSLYAPQDGLGAEYLVGNEDTLNLFVWQNPDLSQDIPIRPDGNCTFPLAGEVHAAGQTIPQITKIVTDRLKQYIKNPLVSISVKTFWEGTKRPGEQKIVILGEVVDPGVHYISGTRTILEAIGQCGGFTRDAVPSSIILIRGTPSNRPTAQRINLSKTLTKGDVSQNVRLTAEDVVFVPRKFISDINYFMQQILGNVQTSKSLEKAVQGGAGSW